jgi:hypothetical protein
VRTYALSVGYLKIISLNGIVLLVIHLGMTYGRSITALILYKDTRMKSMPFHNKSFDSEYASLNVEQVEEIYIELREGTSYSEIGKMFGVSSATIRNVNLGKHFKLDYITYPIVDRRKKYLTEPGENDEFWDWFVPEPYIDRRL